MPFTNTFSTTDLNPEVKPDTRKDSVVNFTKLLRDLVGCGFGILLFVIVLSGSLCAQTEVEGEVSGVWTREGSPYSIIGNAVVFSEDTLHVNPGVEIEFTEFGRIELNGCLIINGQGNDSVFFTGDDHHNYIYNQLERPGSAELYLNYASTLFDSTITGFYKTLEIKHCRVKSYDVDVSEVLDVAHSDFTYDIIPNMENTLRSTFLGAPIDSVVLNDNFFYGMFIYISVPTQLYIYENTGELHEAEEGTMIRSSGDSQSEIYNNRNLEILITGINSYVHDNDLLGIGFMNGPHSQIINNIAKGASLHGASNCIIQNNRFGRTTLDHAIGSTIINNIFLSEGHTAIVGAHRVYNNIFINLDFELDQNFSFSRSCDIRNNIFYSVHGATAALNEGGDTPREYNCFYGFERVYESNEDAPDNCVFANPGFEGGNPFDYSLIHGSPCIDAGDPDMEDDPDGTRPDIGAFFYDQSINQSPSIQSTWYDYASNDRRYSYRAQAVDDDNLVSFTFHNLPEWLGVNAQNESEKWAEIAGNVPQNIHSFTFLIEAIDENDNQDTLSVSVTCLDGTIVKGEISGVLEVENSPYFAVEALTVAEDEALVLEQGVELVFYKPSEFCFTTRTGLTAFGRVELNGDEENPVLLNKASEEELGRFSVAHFFFSEENCIFHNAEIHCDTLQIYNAELMEITDSFITEHVRAREIGDVEILNNNLHGFSVHALRVNFRNNYIHHTSYGAGLKGNFVMCTDNTIEYADGLGVSGDTLHVYSNRLNNNDHGISINTYPGGTVAFVESNTICDCRDYGIQAGYMDNITLRNNIIYRTRLGIDGGFGVGEYNIENNLIRAVHGEDIIRAPNEVGHLDRVNANGDSTDAYGNLFLEPQLIGFGPRRFAPSFQSPAVDAASEDLGENPDGSRADIGFYQFDCNNLKPVIEFCYFPDFQMQNCWQEMIYRFYDRDSDTLHARFMFNDIAFLHKTFLRDEFAQLLVDSVFITDPGIYFFRFELTDGNDLTVSERSYEIGFGGVIGKENETPAEFTVYPAYPNPFNSSTCIEYYLPTITPLKIYVFDVAGRLVLTKSENHEIKGSYSFKINSNQFPNGSYFVRLQTLNSIRVQKITNLK